jgi:hypothetical protein
MRGLSVEGVNGGQMPQHNEVEAGLWTEGTERSEGYIDQGVRWSLPAVAIALDKGSVHSLRHLPP